MFGVLSAGIFLVMPAITETLYFIGSPVWLRCIAEIGTFLLAAGSFFLFKGEVSFEGVFPAEWVKPAKKAKRAKALINNETNEQETNEQETGETIDG